jgi:hypothetical protein
MPRIAAAAGIGYTVSWVIGLAIFSSSTDLRVSDADLASTYAGHRGVVMAQYVLTEGLPAVLLAIVVVALARAAGAAGWERLGRIVLATGLAACAVSLVQCALGLYFAGRLIPDRRLGSAADVYEAVTRLDGVKMFLLAALAAVSFVLGRRVGAVLPPWLAWVAAALAVAIVVSGVGYLLLLGGPALAAWVSLPLLLVYVTATGIVVGDASSVTISEGHGPGTRSAHGGARDG